jgi:formate--tetrahydrofolate ligase
MDLNDRSLRNVKINIKDNIYDESYDITAASEVMAILSLSKDMEDLKYRLGEIIIGSSNGKLIKAKDINAQGAMASILKDAIKPNLVQTLEGNPAIVHTGPFANISIGCSSVISTNTSLSLSNYVITEAGFGADLGAEKFFDIKCRNNFNPSLVVLVATLKSLKYHGSCPIDYCMKENTYYLDKGLSNLYTHVENIKNVFNLNVVVAINKYDTDTMSELNYLCNKLEEKGIIYSITEGYSKGSKGSLDLAQKVINYSNSSSYKCAYDETDDIKTKIKKIATKVYRAKDVIYTNDSLEKISKIEQLGYNLPVCISKTQYSLSDDANNLSCDKDYVINVKDVKLKLGAGYIVVLTGSIFTMPGLPKIPNSNNIDIKNDKITGIF